MKLRIFTLENTWLAQGVMGHGWGNGYVVIPEGHPMHGMHYDAIHDKYPDLDVHYGLTYSGLGSNLRTGPNDLNEKDWVIGFDTAHHGDSLHNWPDEISVINEAKRLAEQCERYSETTL